MSESAGTRLARLLALVPWLSAHDGATIEETALHFGITAEELERDLWLLVVSGLPGHGPDQLVDIDFWDDGVIRVIDPQNLTRPLRLSGEEAMTLLIALRTLAQLPGVEDRAATLSAAAKIEAALEASDERLAVPVIDLALADSGGAAIDAAIASGGALTITYASATRDAISERTVVPTSTSVIDGVGYLEAWCASAEGIRTFRLDRILSASVADRPSTGEQGPEGSAFGPTSGVSEPGVSEPGLSKPGLSEPSPAITALLAVPPHDSWVADVHRGARVSGTTEDGRVLVSIPLHSIDWGVGLVMSLGGSTVALEPELLVKAVAARAAEALGSYPDPLG